MTELNGDKTALKDGLGNILTYTQMKQRVNSITVALDEVQVHNGSRIGVFQEPTSDWICSLLAILRLGAVYVPLDPRLGIARLTTIINDSKPSAILVDSINEHDLQMVESNAMAINVSKLPFSVDRSTLNYATPESIAVIIYTSGSTGVPKGIVMKHASFRNNIESSSKEWYFRTGAEAILQQSAYSFDMSLSQTFLALTTGGTLYVVPRALRGDSIALSNIIISQGVTFTEATPSEYISWLRHGDLKSLRNSDWKVAVSGGEKLTENLLTVFQNLAKSGLRLLDCYGPTEITFCSNSREVPYSAADLASKRKQSSALRTWPNYSIYIVDQDLQAVPLGFSGEVLIAGAGVASSYLNNDILSRERFLHDKFATDDYLSQGWNLMHRTGDRGRLDRDGSLFLEGRITGDTQIKLRGIRIYLCDVEAAIVQASDGGILHAVVSVQSANPEAQILVGYVVFSPSVPVESQEHFLEQTTKRLPLPQYMRPAIMIPLKQLPMNNSNKVDRLAINAMPLRLSQPHQKPSTETHLTLLEQKLRELWVDVLSEDIVSRYTIDSQADFFHVGGSSLLLVTLQSQIQKTFDVSLPLFSLFENSTLGSMASRLGSATEAIEMTEINWEYETQLSSDLWQLSVISKLRPSPAHPKVIVLTGSTGFLGRVILQRLIADDRVRKIHCVAVRRAQQDLPSNLLAEKVEVHYGDLTLPRLGLSERASMNIFMEANTLIHNAADVSFMKSYTTLSRTNLFSTKELVKLCLPYKVPIHYISSASVTHLSRKETFHEVSVAQYPPPSDGSEGYTATKWASERYLEQVNKEFAVPVWIHRPSSITGDGAPAMDLMSNILKYSWLMKAVPYSTHWHGYLDFVPVDEVASAVVHEVFCTTPSTNSVTYKFESGKLEIAVADMQGALEKETNIKFTLLPVGE